MCKYVSVAVLIYVFRVWFCVMLNIWYYYTATKFETKNLIICFSSTYSLKVHTLTYSFTDWYKLWGTFWCPPQHPHLKFEVKQFTSNLYIIQFQTTPEFLSIFASLRLNMFNKTFSTRFVRFQWNILIRDEGGEAVERIRVGLHTFVFYSITLKR